MGSNGYAAAMMRLILMRMVRGYQLAISPLLPASCRYYPSCSAFALEALERYGALKGMRLAIGRILRCHPFRPGGYDPVP
jgi:putative membrane protein insertion efficiency factor